MRNMEFNGKKCYSEEVEKSFSYKKMYLDSIYKLIQKESDKATKFKGEYITAKKLSENKSFYRAEYMNMIGVPSFEGLPEVPDVKKEYVATDDMCRIYRLSVETMPGFWFYGLLMIPNGAQNNTPLVIAQHGGGGTPEYCCDMYGKNNYANFSKRALEKGFVVFAPQLLLWNFDVNTNEIFPSFNLKFDRAKIDKDLKRVGLSITGVEVFSIMRCIDYLKTLDVVDENRIGMMGLSYGGFFSLYTAAADERIISIYDAASFNDRRYVFFSDWQWHSDILMFNEAEVAGLCCPRNLIIDVGKEDPVFDYRHSTGEAERARAYYEYENASDKFTYNLWEGGHRFDIDGGSMDDFFETLRGEEYV